MSEIEKMFENAGIENYRLDNFCGFVPDGYKIIPDKNKKDYVKEIVRDFTAEKQLELIKFIALKKDIDYAKYYFEVTRQVWVFLCVTKIEFKVYCAENEKFEETLAVLVNQLWQDLTEEEQKQIKDILNG